MPGGEIAATAGGTVLQGTQKDQSSSSTKGAEANNKWPREVDSEYPRAVFPGDCSADSQQPMPGLGWELRAVSYWWEMTVTTILSIHWCEIDPVSPHILTLFPLFTIHTDTRGIYFPAVSSQFFWNNFFTPNALAFAYWVCFPCPMC